MRGEIRKQGDDVGPDDSATKQCPQGSGRLDLMHRKETGYTHLERPWTCILLKWQQQPDFKGVKPFCKGARNLSTPAVAGSSRHPMPSGSFLINTHSFLQRSQPDALSPLLEVSPAASCWLSGTPGDGEREKPLLAHGPHPALTVPPAPHPGKH